MDHLTGIETLLEKIEAELGTQTGKKSAGSRPEEVVTFRYVDPKGAFASKKIRTTVDNLVDVVRTEHPELKHIINHVKAAQDYIKKVKAKGVLDKNTLKKYNITEPIPGWDVTIDAKYVTIKDEEGNEVMKQRRAAYRI